MVTDDRRAAAAGACRDNPPVIRSADPFVLPPGQVLTERFPLVGEQAPAPGLTPESCRITISGRVAQPLTIHFAELLARPSQQRVADIHCVTGWSRRALVFRGWPLAEVLAAARVTDDARHVRFIAHSRRAHDTSLPLALALADTWLVHEIDGEPLSPEHGGPLRTVTPGRYFYKSLKWLAAIELLAEDRPGYWERVSAYHNEADFLSEQRFDEARIASAETVAQFREAADFSGWRDTVLLKARLGGWQPRTLDLAGIQAKACSFRNAALAGVNLRGANLSLSNLEGADLRGADFSGADLEGASLAGADLRGARMVDVALSATRFFRDFANGKRLAARVDGLVIENPQGLLETQAAFLSGQGVRCA